MAGCVAVDDGYYSGTTRSTVTTPVYEKKRGVYHKVNTGETLYSIAKAYGADMTRITASNNIPNVAHLEVNQLLFIPGADQVVDVPVTNTVSAADSDQGGFGWPVEGKILNYFGQRKGLYLNKGIGIQARLGQPVVAARGGTVVFADYFMGYGHTVILDHGDGLMTVYAYNDKLLVRLGDRVRRGDRIAEVGQKGDLAFSHFEVRKNGQADNPLFYLPKL